jgi:F0F1-type ATP synthase assembly protein I
MTDKKVDKNESQPSEFQKVSNSYRTGWAYAEIAFQYGAAIVICTLIGYWIDNVLNTGGIFTIIGVFLGATAGFLILLRTLKVYDYRKKKAKDT